MNAPIFKATALSSILLFAASTNVSASDYTMEAWEAKLRTKLENVNDYPSEAMRAGVEGTVKVRLTFGESGDVNGAELIEKSGSRELDRTVLKMALRLNDVPALPEGQKQVSLIVPVTFKIKDKS